MEQQEMQRRYGEAMSQQDRDYWDDWLSSLEWGQFVAAWAELQNWDGQLIEMIKQGYLPDHPYAVLYSPDQMLEGCRT